MASLYRIRRTSDGQYSLGGSWPRFGPQGKIWRKNHLGAHLTLVGGSYNKKSFDDPTHVYYNCEIVEIEIKDTNVTPVRTYAAQRNNTTP